MADGTEGAETTPRLNLNKGHPAGHTSVAWFKSEGTWHAVTAGADSRVVTRHPRNNQEIKNVEGQHGAWKCLMTSPDGSTVAGVDDQYVKVGIPHDNTATAVLHHTATAIQQLLQHVSAVPIAVEYAWQARACRHRSYYRQGFYMSQ